MAKQTFTTGQVLTAAQMTSLQQTAMLGGAASAKTASYTLVAADAGTAISMSSASATTITVNTALFAAGDTVQITNLGVGVCTITAGTATVNTSASLALAQYEGGTLNFTSTSAAIFIKGAGATAPAGGLTLISTTTLSGASVTLSSIPSTYKHLQLIISGVTANTSNNALRILPNNVSNLSNGTGQRGFPGGPDAPEYSNSAILPYIGNNSLRTNANNTVQLTIYNYASSTQIKSFMISHGMVSSSSVNNYAVSGGSFVSTTAITSLVIDYGGSNTFTAGEVLFYGVS
jgi:hypothetical protein